MSDVLHGHRCRCAMLLLTLCALVLPLPIHACSAAEQQATQCVHLHLTDAHDALGQLSLSVTGQATGTSATQARPPSLTSRLNLAGLDGRLSYELHYALDAGDILSDAQALHTLAAERREQRWGLRLATLGGQAAVLEHRRATRQRWTIDGLRQEQEEHTALNWRSPRAQLQLRMASPLNPGIDPSTGLHCDTSASLTLRPQGGAAGRSAAGSVHMLAKGCRLPRDDAGGVRGGRASTLELSYRRESPRGSDTLRFSQLSAEHPGGGPDTHTYQLQWRHQRERGPWRTSAHASVRHQATLEEPREETLAIHPVRWTANASIARELVGGTAFARWSSDNMAPALFDAAPVARTGRLHLGVDLSRWLDTLVPRTTPSLIMQWQSTLSGVPHESRSRQHSVDLKVAMRW